MPPWQRPPRPEPAPSRPSPVLEMMAAEFEARPWHGGGEFIVSAPPPPPPPAERLQIEPPPWSLAGEVAVDVTELAAEDQPLARPKPPPPPWKQEGEQ